MNPATLVTPRFDPSHLSCEPPGSASCRNCTNRRWTTAVGNEWRSEMATHRIGSREQWQAARIELLKAEKELTRRGDDLARQRQELPWVRIDKEYRFDTNEGNVSLADLFRGRSQLLVYHFMF